MTIQRIGIAGFMGAGKTTLTRLLSESGFAVAVINADAEAKHLMQRDPVIKNKLAHAFGPSIIPNATIDFKLLADAVFRNRNDLLSLNAIVHPALLTRLKELVFSEGAPLTLCDAALIPLWRIETWFDRVVWVRASFDTRLNRLSKKSSLARDNLVARMQIQQELFPEPENAPWKFVDNNATISELKKQTMRLVASISDSSKT